MQHKFNSAGSTIICGELILLAKRINYHQGRKVIFGGHWSIFGGEREPPSEKPIHCAARELFEETGVNLKSSQLNHVSALRRGIYFFDVYVSYIDKRPEIKLNEEHTEYGWFTIDYLNIMPNPMDEELRECIMNYHTKRKMK